MVKILGTDLGEKYKKGYSELDKGEKLTEDDFFPDLEKLTGKKRK